MCGVLGHHYVLNALREVHWHVHTMFSGMGCPKVALAMLRAGVRNIGPDFSTLEIDINVSGIGLDNRPECRKVLKHNYGDRCIFGDVQDFVASGQTLDKIKFKTCCHCYTHNQDCPLAPSRQEGVASVTVAGPPCTPWSKRGKRQGNKDPQAHTHIIWAKYFLENKIDLVVFECVYDDEVLRNVLEIFGKDYTIRHAKVSAFGLGYCVSPERLYVIMVRHQSVFKWTSEKSLEEMLKPLLSRTVMKLADTFMLSNQDVQGNTDSPYAAKVEKDFNKSELKRFQMYKEKFPGKLLWDLSQNPNFSATTELKNGALPGLTTNCRSLYITQMKRTMTAAELLLNQGIPVTEIAARAANVSRLEFPVSASAMVRMAGNGMHVPSVGAILLLAMFHITRKEDEVPGRP
jgi:site-specific DNA-cytosine methylase